MSELPTPQNYAPAAGESAAEYSARITAAQGLPKEAVRAATILAKAMDMGLYTPGDENPDSFAKALEHLSTALKKFDSTQGLAQADDRLMNEALRQVSARLGRKVDAGTARRLIEGKAQSDLPQAITAGISACWAEIKNASDVADEANVSNKKVVDSYKDHDENGRAKDNDLSELVAEVLDLRDSLRAQGGGQSRGGKKRK